MDTTTPKPESRTYTRSELEHMDIDDLDRLAFGVVGGQVVELAPSQIHIRYHGDLANPQALFDEMGMAWARTVDLSEPIEVSVDDHGDFYLEDGHHRWFAAGKTNQRLTAALEIKGKPIEKILAAQEASPAVSRGPRVR